MKYVISSPNVKSKALKNLANELSAAVGYRVGLVRPNVVRNRKAIQFLNGIDKITQLRAFTNAGVSCPKYTTDNNINTFTSKYVVARQLINASEGKGIVIFRREDPPPPAPLYVEYITKKKEFRVHVWNGEVIDVAEKRKRKGYDEGHDTKVRNTANGYVFCRTNISEPGDLRDVATGAVRSLGRTYGAVDVIWNEKQNKCFVLEVNSRPGMEGSTVGKYVQAILKRNV